MLVTQNVDGLHQEAGSQNVVEMHGSLKRVKNSNSKITCAEYLLSNNNHSDMYRPDVVLFGEVVPHSVYMEAKEAIDNADVLLGAFLFRSVTFSDFFFKKKI